MVKKSAVLVSGGIDSTVLLAERLQAGDQVHPIYIREGLRWESAELQSLRRFLKAIPKRRLKELTVLDLPMKPIYGQHWSLGDRRGPTFRAPDEAVYLPGRNLGLIAVASLYCIQKKIPVLYLAPLKGNPFPDSCLRFFKIFEKVIHQGTQFDLQVRAPYLRWNKAEVISQGKDLPLHLTLSCVNPLRGRHCNRCNKCAERKRGFQKAGIEDKTVYAKRR